jgi:hypothetical protein
MGKDFDYLQSMPLKACIYLFKFNRAVAVATSIIGTICVLELIAIAASCNL